MQKEKEEVEEDGGAKIGGLASYESDENSDVEDGVGELQEWEQEDADRLSKSGDEEDVHAGRKARANQIAGLWFGMTLVNRSSNFKSCDPAVVKITNLIRPDPEWNRRLLRQLRR